MNKLVPSLLILSLATIAPGPGPEASAQDEGARSAFAPQANVIKVPRDYATIQAAVKAASPVLNGLRHEVAYVFVVPQYARTQPSVLPLVLYRAMRSWEHGGVKCPGQWSYRRKTSARTVRRWCAYERQRGEALEWMVWRTQVNR